MGLESFFGWLQTQAEYLLFIGIIILSIVLGFKRQWIALVGSLCGFAIIGLFIVNPELIKSIGTTIAGWIGLG